MNKKMMIEHLKTGAKLRLRPIPERFEESGHPLPKLDDHWSWTKNPIHSGIELKNHRTDHIFSCYFDRIRQFNQPDFLILRGKMRIKGQAIEFEPSLNPSKRSEPLPIRCTDSVQYGTCEIGRLGCDSPNGAGFITQINHGQASIISVCRPCLDKQIECGDWYESG